MPEKRERSYNRNFFGRLVIYRHALDKIILAMKEGDNIVIIHDGDHNHASLDEMRECLGNKLNDITISSYQKVEVTEGQYAHKFSLDEPGWRLITCSLHQDYVTLIGSEESLKAYHEIEGILSKHFHSHSKFRRYGIYLSRDYENLTFYQEHRSEIIVAIVAGVLTSALSVVATLAITKFSDRIFSDPPAAGPSTTK